MLEPPLGVDAIEQYVGELPSHGPQHTVILVGGALLAWHGLRDATRDVDSATRLDENVTAAVARVADRHRLAPKWLNDSAAPFVPVNFEADECAVLMEWPALRVLGAPFDQVSLMKLYAARAVDTEDMEALWPLCSFGSPETAADAFYKAYPLEERDEFLADFIRHLV